MIKDILQKCNGQILEEVRDWREAIQVCCRPLIRTGYITEQYPKAIIENTCTYGPYYVLCTDVALLHARPQDGVIKQQLGLTVLKHPVYFQDKKVPARLLITLAATDAQSHLEVLQQIAQLLNNTEKIEELLSLQDRDQLYTAFAQLKPGGEG